MSNLATSTGRKKPRTKEGKLPAGSRRRSTLSHHLLASTVVGDDASAMAPTDVPYVCVGRFAVDFVQLCRRAHLSYIPHVVARPHRPSPASVADEKRSTGFTAKPARLVALHAAPDQSLAVDAGEGFIPEPPPKTYVVRDSISFFRPSVQVEVDKVDKVLVEQAAVTEVYIRGWKVDDVMMAILAECFPAVTSLHTVDLWNVGLTDVTLAKLANVLARCRALRTLALDANCVPSQRWQLLIENESPLVHLSLRYCGITALGAKYLSESLGSATRQNTRLQSLDLAGNYVSDSGAASLANALRLNRTLLVLNLAANGIGDVGASQLAVVLSTFELTHDEVVERRRLHRAQRLLSHSRLLRHGSKLPARRVSSTQSVGHQRGRKRVGGSPSERTDHSKAGKQTGKTSKSPRATPSDDGKSKKEKTTAKTKKASSSHTGRGLESSESSQALDKSLASERAAYSLLSIAVLRESTVAQPTTLVRGNRTLISLNLSRNEIGQVGMMALLDAVLPLCRDPVPADPLMPGLLRITVHNNRACRSVLHRSTASVGADTGREVDTTARYLTTAISSRDPLLRHSTPSTSKLAPMTSRISFIDAVT